MRLRSGYDDRKVRMELLPLMDVMFLLLLAFVYASFAMTVHRGLKVALPTSAQAPLLRGERIVITVSSGDRLSLDGISMELDELLEGALHRWREQGLPVLISADRAASMGVGISLLGALKNGGVEEVSFQVEKERSTAER